MSGYVAPTRDEPGRSADGKRVYAVRDDAGYEGAGWAWAVLSGGEAVRLVYIDPIATMGDEPNLVPLLARRFQAAAEAAAVALNAGPSDDAAIGLCSAWEFIAYDPEQVVQQYIGDFLTDLSE